MLWYIKHYQWYTNYQWNGEKKKREKRGPGPIGHLTRDKFIKRKWTFMKLQLWGDGYLLSASFFLKFINRYWIVSHLLFSQTRLRTYMVHMEVNDTTSIFGDKNWRLEILSCLCDVDTSAMWGTEAKLLIPSPRLCTSGRKGYRRDTPEHPNVLSSHCFWILQQPPCVWETF